MTTTKFWQIKNHEACNGPIASDSVCVIEREDEDGIRKIVLDEFDKRGQIIDAVSKKEFTIYFDKYGNAYNSVTI